MDLNGLIGSAKIDEVRVEKKEEEHPVEIKKSDEPQTNGVTESASSPPENKSAETQAQAKEVTKEKTKCKKEHKHKKGKKKKSSKKAAKEEESSDSDSEESDATDTPSESESESSSEDESRRKKKAKKAKRRAQQKKSKKHAKSKRYESSSSESESSDESESESSDDEVDRRRHHRSRKSRKDTEEESELSDEEADMEINEAHQNDPLAQYLQQQYQQMQLLKQQQLLGKKLQSGKSPTTTKANNAAALEEALGKQKKSKKKGKQKPKKPKKGSTLEYKRVDQLWDSTIHNYKLTESAEDRVNEFDEFLFTVRRNFNWENKYRDTVIDIKSKLLRDALAEVMKDVKCVSLVEEQPCLDPNILFLYLEDLRKYYRKTLKARLKKEKKRKNQRKIKDTMAHCKVLVGYLDEDYEDIKKRLYPMLEAGNITFDLLWALFKPNSIALTSTYGSWDEPRCFKVDYANKETSFVKGEWYCIEGRYLEFDGKNFGLGDFEIDIDHFQGPRRISSLAVYPLQYHKDKDGIKKTLVDRGKRFVELAGMNYRFHKGLAFHKKRKTVFKFNINGRIMIDPAIFRRINPNYPISLIKPKDADDLFSDDDDSSDCGCGYDSDSDDGGRRRRRKSSDDENREKPMTKFKVILDDKDQPRVVEVPIDEDGREIRPEKLEKVAKDGDTKEREFTEEELLIASPVVLGFAFSEKQWLEFTISGVREIEWNEGAFESLVIPPDRKSIVKALVSSHKFHPAQTIDDVVQGKGKGLVFVLHGPPGVGKTLTGEGIAEFLKCPLYAVSAGDLGTESHMLEMELQKIMDIAHSWGAVLLLDEADVFLEKRQHQDVHRNALVSIFLRLLEYFQGILFLTTNRVDTFDEAFQSRIHLPLRYEELTFKARKEIWKMFLEKVRVVEGIETMPFRDEDFSSLARHNLNGRQVWILFPPLV